MRRVLHAFDYFSRYTVGLANGQRERGWQTALVYHEHDHAFGEVPGALERYLDEQAAGMPRFPVRGRVRDLRMLRSVVNMARACRAWKPDVVHAQLCLPNDPRLLAVAPLRPGRFAVTVHDVEVHPGDPAVPFYKSAQAKWLVSNAGVVFVHAEPLREQLLARWRVRGPVVVVPHGIDRAEPAPLPSAPSLLLFGRISTYKGVDVLLDAMPLIWEREPATTLTIAGAGPLPDSPLLNDPRVRLRHEHVPDDDVPDLFNGASLVVLPYREASQSGVGSLAKGYGRPLLVTDVGGLPELVADGSGITIPAGDARALADAACALLADREGLERLAAAALRSVTAQAGWDVVGERTIEAYERHLLAVRGRSVQRA